MTFFTMGQKRIDVYPCTILGSPVIYRNTFSAALKNIDFTGFFMFSYGNALYWTVLFIYKIKREANLVL